MNPAVWWTNWAWSVPLVVLTVVIHVFGLEYINAKFIQMQRPREARRFTPAFVIAMSAVVVAATVLHAFEAILWACVYRYLGALPDNRSAMLYSLGAMTTSGSSNVALDDHWAMLGAVEALNGILLFGLTTAYMFGMVQEVWRIRRTHKEGGQV